MRIFALFLLCFSFAHLAPAQDTRGTISGTVTDSQAAVIAGATVIVANTGTGTSTRLTTNAGGYFEAPLLLPGSYGITVETSGFKRSVRSGLTLGIGERLQIDFQLDVGGTSESVTVSSEAPLLDTSTVSTGRAILGGWQIAATYEFQPGPLLGWGNLFYYGDLSSFETDAAAGTKTLDRWFNTDLRFERNASNLPAAFHARVFPRFFNGLRADGPNQWNGNLLREFRIKEGLTLQLRGDAINVYNRSQMGAPDLSPTSTNFGRITSQTSSLNRFYQIQARIQF